MRSPASRLFLQLACALLLATLTAAHAWAYEDVIYKFSVQAPVLRARAGKPKPWIPMVKRAVVPGIFRFGWVSPSATDRSGANVLAFVMLLDDNVPVDKLMEANVKSFETHGVKVVKKRTLTVAGNPAFEMEVVGPGTGFAMLPQVPGRPGASPTPPAPKGHAQLTHQRWYAVERDKKIIGLMSTCSEDRYKSYASIFQGVEKSLVVR